jgi:hypothetical protein
MINILTYLAQMVSGFLKLFAVLKQNIELKALALLHSFVVEVKLIKNYPSAVLNGPSQKKRGKTFCIQAVRWGRKFMGQFQERSWLCATDREIFHTAKAVMVAR